MGLVNVIYHGDGRRGVPLRLLRLKLLVTLQQLFMVAVRPIT